MKTLLSFRLHKIGTPSYVLWTNQRTDEWSGAAPRPAFALGNAGKNLPWYSMLNVSHLGYTSGSSDIIMNGENPGTIPPKFGPSLPSSFRREDFFYEFYEFSIFSNGSHLGWQEGSSQVI